MEKSNDSKIGYSTLSQIPAYLLTGIGFSLLYLFTLSPNLSVAHDSISYLSALSDTAISGNGHHLLQHTFTTAWIKIGQWLGFEDFLLIANSLNALAGGLMLGLLFRIAHQRLKLSKTTSLATVIVAGFSYGIWAYSTVLEVYMLPLCLMIASIYRLTSSSPRAWIGALALHILATLFHQMHLLWVPVAMLYLYFDQGPYLRYAIIWGLGVGLSYLLFMWGVLGYTSYGEMQNFILGLTQEEYFWGMGGSLGVLVGNARAWIGGHFIFALGTDGSSVLGNFATADDQYLVSELSALGLWTCLGLSLLVGLLLLRFYAFTLLKLWRTPAGERSTPWLLAGGILLYSAFFLIWVPINPEFWLMQLLLWSLLFAWQGQKRPYLMWCLGLGLLLVNYTGSIQWLQSSEHDLYYQKAQFWKTHTQGDELILVESGWPQIDFATYFTNSRLLVLETAGPDSIIKVAKSYDRILLEPNLKTVLKLNPKDWRVQSMEGPIGSVEIWERNKKE